MSRHSFPPVTDAETLPFGNSAPDSDAASSGNSLADGRSRNDCNRNDVTAALIARDSQRLTCGACDGTGRHAHYLGGCSFCRGIADTVSINMALAAEGERIAAGMDRPATCSGCHGSGRKDYGFGERSCDYCNGSGLHIDECRQELVDAIGDKLADTNDLDVGWTQFARAVVELLEERGADVTALARP